MKVISYNINGIRAGIKKGLIDWLKATDADVICLQEIKATPEQLDLGLFDELGYHLYWFPAVKKGYSGVAIFSKIKANKVTYGCGIERYDSEGRILTIDLNGLSIMSVYMPSGSSSQERQNFKLEWLKDFQEYIDVLKQEKEGLLIAGDFNICREAIDIHNPIQNANSPGFTPEEREWFSQFLSNDFVDSFRILNTEPHQYTWWSYRTRAREKNLGWRIDYQILSKHMEDKIQRCVHLDKAYHSDHCPILIDIDL